MALIFSVLTMLRSSKTDAYGGGNDKRHAGFVC